jgi:very-long-chain enoyl-CoA reductase
MHPRLHNALSYSGAALVFLACLPKAAPQAALVGGLFCFHFLRRTLEALFVHRYSGRPVPPSDFLVEYVYYWGFAAWIAWSLGRPNWVPPSSTQWLGGGLVFLLGEAGNAWAHQKLRALRMQSGESKKGIPSGGLFEWVSCPHYLFEIVSWCGFFWVTRVWASGAFLALGAAIVASYAYSRHRSYKKEFDGQEGRASYPLRRKAIVPLLF